MKKQHLIKNPLPLRGCQRWADVGHRLEDIRLFDIPVFNALVV
jgi:hypothetical protein